MDNGNRTTSGIHAGGEPILIDLPILSHSSYFPNGLSEILSDILNYSSEEDLPSISDIIQQNSSSQHILPHSTGQIPPSTGQIPPSTGRNPPSTGRNPPSTGRNPPRSRRKTRLTTQIHTVQRPTIEYRSNSNTLDLNQYIEAFGNFDNTSRLYFIAARFKKPVVSYMHKGFNTAPIEPPEDTAVIIPTFMDLNLVRSSSSLLFSVKTPHSNCYYAPNTSPNALLRALFPDHSILFGCFDSSTLYVVTKHNPFQDFWHRNTREKSFRALVHLYEICQRGKRGGNLTLEDVAKLRFFHRNEYNPKLFKTWYSLALSICEHKVNRILGRMPSAQCGKDIHGILTRARNHQIPKNHPPLDFYTCELLFDETLSTGVAFRVECEEVVYVSPMVVSDSKQGYRDSNFVTCNRWLPMLKNMDHLNNFVVPWYARRLKEKLYLSQVIAWVSIQTAEKYRFLQTDLEQVHAIVHAN